MNEPRPTRVVIAGQLPPPQSGMHIVVQMALDHLAGDPDLVVDHLRFGFSGDFKDNHRPTLRKLVELMRVIARQLSLRRSGPIDVTLYPIGGVSFSSTIRDLAVLPFVLLCSRRTVFHFHGAGHADQWEPARWWTRAARMLYRRGDRAIVMTDFNRVDPQALGIDDVVVVPHHLADAFDAGRAPTSTGPVTLLYMGHLGQQRRTDELISAFATVARRRGDVRLHLVGQPLNPYQACDLHRAIQTSGVSERITHDEVLKGEDKWEAFRRASWFVFPSVFECESFGLVLAEAMMFGLPIVLTDWRGNLDVVDARADRIVVDPDPDSFQKALADALDEAVERTRDGLGFSTANRTMYEERFGDLSRWGLRDALVGAPVPGSG